VAQLAVRFHPPVFLLLLLLFLLVLLFLFLFLFSSFRFLALRESAGGREGRREQGSK